ncbi:MAG TPA: dUTP diphosphatase [Atribacterota bacterium]|nr:dUTP diphosphatase [Atribacterota bacterium]
MNKEIEKIEVKIEKDKGCDDLPIPKAASQHASGIDLFSAEEDVVEIDKGEIKLVSTGVKIALPIGFEAQVRPRSGLAYRYGITVLNTPGTIDSDYRGVIKIILINHGKEKFIVNRGDRIAQLVIQRIFQPVLVETKELDNTKRGIGGFGHTGIKTNQ